MDLKNFKIDLSLFKSKKAKLLVVIVIGLILLISFLVIKNKNEKQTETITVQKEVAKVDLHSIAPINAFVKEKQTGTFFINPKIKSELEKLPQNIAIYEYQTSTFFNEQNIKNLFDIWNLKITNEVQSPNQGKVIIASNTDYSAVARFGIKQFAYTKLQTNVSGNISQKTPAEYENAVHKELEKLGLNISNYPDKTFGYLKKNASRFTIVDTPQNAELIEITYYASINGTPFIDKDAPQNPNFIKIMLNADLQIQNLEYEDVGNTIKQTSSVDLINGDQVVRDIEQGKLILVDAKSMSSDNFVNTTLNSIKIAYVPKDNLTIPVLILSGFSKTESGESVESYYLMDAIKRNE